MTTTMSIPEQLIRSAHPRLMECVILEPVMTFATIVPPPTALVEAAPDMLAALQLWAAYVNDPHCGHDEFFAAVRATDDAIHKAMRE